LVQEVQYNEEIVTTGTCLSINAYPSAYLWLVQRLQVVAAARVPLAKVVAARQVGKWSLREVGTLRALAGRSHLLCVGNVHAMLACYPLAAEAWYPLPAHPSSPPTIQHPVSGAGGTALGSVHVLAAATIIACAQAKGWLPAHVSELPLLLVLFQDVGGSDLRYAAWPLQPFLIPFQ
jgi:hypothetical protein